jgi:succinylglutamate desuccinylase/aspartoacylase family protein
MEALMAGTPYETDLHLIESGHPGQTVLVLAGVHGNEPGAWLAAQRLLDSGFQPAQGKLLILPRANALAVLAGVRSTPEMGDLNRLYFGDPDIFPMARMAAEIAGVVESHDVDVLLDLHESWDFHEKTSNEVVLSALGQTISPHRSEPSLSFARALVDATNDRLPESQAFHYHVFPPGHVDALIVPLPLGVSEDHVPRKSALDLPDAFPGLVSILVEVGQQQSMERRVTQQVAIVEALLELLEAGVPSFHPLG